MPSRIITEVAGDIMPYGCVFPGIVLPIHARSTATDEVEMVVVGCEPDDTATHVFQIRVPKSTDNIAELCTDENHIIEITAADDLRSIAVKTSEREKQTYLIGHIVTMHADTTGQLM